MIQMLRKEACSGGIDDLAHVRSEDCLSDCLTKHSAKPDNLIKAVGTGILPNVDVHPSFRGLLKHKAYLSDWAQEHLQIPSDQSFLLMEEIAFDNRIVQADTWTIHDDCIVRTHVVPRTCLFIPQYETCPVSLEELETERETVVNECCGMRVMSYKVSDSWIGSDAARPWTQKWTGESRFFLRNKRLHADVHH